MMATNTYGQTKPGLRRKPKIYNALITTDENLVQSRAYPVIQPTIHESGIAHYAPFGPYGPYTGLYNPHVVRFGQPIVPNLMPKEQVGNNINVVNIFWKIILILFSCSCPTPCQCHNFPRK